MFPLLFNALGILLFLFLVYVLIRDPRAIAGPVVFLAASSCLFFGNLDKIELLRASGTGFEAKTREVISEAKDTIALVRKLAVITAGLQVKLLAAEGRLQGPASLLQKDEQKERLLADLRSIGLTEEEVRNVAAADDAWIKWDYAIAILQPLNDQANRAQLTAYTEVYSRYSNPPSPTECEQLLQRFGLQSDESKALLEDYRYYIETGKHRRPEVWRQRPGGLAVAPWAMGPQ